MSTGPSGPTPSTGGEGDGPTGRSPGGRGTPAAGRSGRGETPNPPTPPAAAGEGSGGTGGSDRAGRGSTRPSRREEADAKPIQTGGTGADLPKKRGGDAAPPVEPPTPFTQQLGRITIIVLAALFGVFAVANSQRVDFSWVFGETLVQESATGEVTGGFPLIILLLTAFAVGSLVTLLVERFVTRSRRARRAAKEGKKDSKRRSD